MFVGGLIPIKHVGAEQEKKYFCVYNYLYLLSFVYSAIFSWTRLISPLSWSPRGHNWYRIILCVCACVCMCVTMGYRALITQYLSIEISSQLCVYVLSIYSKRDIYWI